MSTTITIEPGDTPARDLPFGMALDVCAVLEAYGLQIKHESLKGRGITEVIIALGHIINATPTDLGGRQS